MKTPLRKEINQAKWDKLLLKDASLFQISKCLVKKTFDSGEFWFACTFILLAVLVYGKVMQ